MSCRQGVVDLQCSQRSGLCNGESLKRRDAAESSDKTVEISQTCVGSGEERVHCNSLRGICNSFLNSFWCPLIRGVHCLQINVIRLTVFGWPHGEELLFFRRRSWAKAFNDTACEFFLKIEAVVQLAIVLAAPKLSVVRYEQTRERQCIQPNPAEAVIYVAHQIFCLRQLCCSGSSSLHAEAHCPGNVASIRPRVVSRSLITVPVILDGSGLYDFVVDTGAQITTIDVQLSAELHPKALGPTHVVGVGAYSRAAYAQLQLLQAGIYSMKDPLVLVQDLTQTQQIDPRIRGILGENFLAHYDLLIDYAHQILSLDGAKQMQSKVKGERIALTPVPDEGMYLPYTLPLVVSTRLSGISNRRLLMQLDSGIDVPVLFES